MLSKEMWKQISYLRKYYFSQREVAKKMGISRNTVRKYWDSETPPKFKKRKNYKHKTDQFSKRIQKLMDKGSCGTVIYEKLKEEGYSGGLSTLYREIKRIKTKKRKNMEKF